MDHIQTIQRVYYRKNREWITHKMLGIFMPEEFSLEVDTLLDCEYTDEVGSHRQFISIKGKVVKKKLYVRLVEGGKPVRHLDYYVDGDVIIETKN